MEKEKLYIERKASDNKYLHRDFFVTSDIGISYVGENYGDDAVIEYLEQYAKSYYKLLVKEVINKGLVALKDYFVTIYKKEEWEENVQIILDKNVLTVKTLKCPAVTYMKSVGHVPSKWYKQTVYTVYGVLAKECGLDFEVKYYSEIDGSMEIVFRGDK
jgi:hypothetical protein